MAARSNTGRSGRTRTTPAKATPKTQTIKSPGKTPITFHPGGLHESLGVPQGQPIPPAKMSAAKRGDYGPKAKQQAEFAANVLTGPKSGGTSSKPTTTRKRGASRGKAS